MAATHLIIAEKPSLGRAIAMALLPDGSPAPRSNKDGFLAVDQYLIASLAGHVLEQFMPEDYDPALEKWSLEDLPFLPKTFKLKPSKDKKRIITAIAKQLKSVESIIHAGDPDREGQLLVDELLLYLNNTKPVKRLMLYDLEPKAIQSAFNDLRCNSQFQGAYQSALCRSHCDWVYGLNLTRYYTLKAKEQGHSDLLSVGRVQTPLLAIIVRKEQAILNFKPTIHYGLKAQLTPLTGEPWTLDATGFVKGDQTAKLGALDKPTAQSLLNLLYQKKATIMTVEASTKVNPTALLYSLSSLQIDLDKRYGLGPKETLQLVQKLYETHKIVSYPRTDCPYLPMDHFAHAQALLELCLPYCESLKVNLSDLQLKEPPRAYNSNKVTAHYALVPTRKDPSECRLSVNEARVYQAVCERFVQQFLPEKTTTTTTVTARINDLVFTGAQKKDGTTDSTCSFQVDQCIESPAITVHQHTSKPPARFSKGELIGVMEKVGPYVGNPKLKAILKDVGGIGTPATQSDIIELLFEREYLTLKQKKVVPTPKGFDLIQQLPDVCTWPDLTAIWETLFNRIETGECSYAQALKTVIDQINSVLSPHPAG